MDYIEIYEDKAGGWRWRRVAANNEEISSGESHQRYSDALRAAARANGGNLRASEDSPDRYWVL